MICEECGAEGEDYLDVDGDDSIKGEERYVCSDKCLNDFYGRMG